MSEKVLPRSIRFLALIVPVLAMVLPSSAATYSVTDLGVLTGAESKPCAINNRGHVAAINMAGGSYRAFLYQDGSWTNLGTLGGNESFASGINDAGQVVGKSKTAGGIVNAFLWTPGGTDGVPTNPQMKNLGTLGGINSEANAINTSGSSTGYAQTSSRDHAFIHNGLTMMDLGALIFNALSISYSYGFGINDSGHVAGTAYGSHATAFFYNGTTVANIGHLGGGEASALAINDRNHIIGYSSVNKDRELAFFYDGLTMRNLGSLGGDYSYALAINGSDIVVGGSFVDAGNATYHAFASAGHTLVDLNTRLNASGAGWTLEEAHGINDAGQIVGTGRYAGVAHAFLLSPARPTITGLTLDSSNVVVSFTTSSNSTYSLNSIDNLAGAPWSTQLTGITGQGTQIAVTNTDVVPLFNRFYRIELDLP